MRDLGGEGDTDPRTEQETYKMSLKYLVITDIEEAT